MEERGRGKESKGKEELLKESLEAQGGNKGEITYNRESIYIFNYVFYVSM